MFCYILHPCSLRLLLQLASAISAVRCIDFDHLQQDWSVAARFAAVSCWPACRFSRHD